jgi:hypothetical protein
MGLMEYKVEGYGSECLLNIAGMFEVSRRDPECPD